MTICCRWNDEHGDYVLDDYDDDDYDDHGDFGDIDDYDSCEQFEDYDLRSLCFRTQDTIGIASSCTQPTARQIINHFIVALNHHLLVILSSYCYDAQNRCVLTISP